VFTYPLFSGPGYAMLSCIFSWKPLLLWQPTVFVQRQNWLQTHKSVKRWNAAARLYSVAWDRYLVPQNIFLVANKVIHCVAEKVPLCDCLYLRQILTDFSFLWKTKKFDLSKTLKPITLLKQNLACRPRLRWRKCNILCKSARSWLFRKLIN